MTDNSGSAAFLATRARWSGGNVPNVPQPNVETDLSGESVAPAVDSNHAPAEAPAEAQAPAQAQAITQPKAFPATSSSASESCQVNTHILQRIAEALEKIAAILPTVAQAHPSTEPAQVVVPSPATLGDPPVQPPTPDFFEVIDDQGMDIAEGGASHETSMEEGNGDPTQVCGVCRAPCPTHDLNALDCGHYPYCSYCIEQMTINNTTLSIKFKCPVCQKSCINPLKLNLED